MPSYSDENSSREMTETKENDDDDVEQAGGDDAKKRRKRKRKRKKADQEDDDKETDALEPQASKEQEVDRTVFVEGIPYDCTRDEVMAFFQQHLTTDALGTATDDDKPEAESMMITDIRLPTWPDTGRLKGYGHVVFATCELQQAACALTTKRLYLKKRYLNIAPAKAPSSGQQSGSMATTTTPIKGEPSKTIVLHNLSFDATEDDILQVLNDSHIVQGGVRVVRHNATKRSRGFAYVEFDTIEHAEEATAHPIMVLGRPCRVDYDHGAIQKSFRTDTGRLWHKSYGQELQKKQRATR